MLMNNLTNFIISSYAIFIILVIINSLNRVEAAKNPSFTIQQESIPQTLKESKDY